MEQERFQLTDLWLSAGPAVTVRPVEPVIEPEVA